MKKLLVVVLAVALMCGVGYAAQDINEIIDTTLSTTVPAIEADRSIEGANTVTFFATLDNTRTTAAVTATVTAAASIDGTNWQDISWFDTAGGATPQTTETTTLAKQTYVGWLDNRLGAKYIRIRVNAVNISDNPSAYGSGDTATLTVNVVEKR